MESVHCAASTNSLSRFPQMSAILSQEVPSDSRLNTALKFRKFSLASFANTRILPWVRFKEWPNRCILSPVSKVTVRARSSTSDSRLANSSYLPESPHMKVKGQKSSKKRGSRVIAAAVAATPANSTVKAPRLSLSGWMSLCLMKVCARSRISAKSSITSRYAFSTFFRPRKVTLTVASVISSFAQIFPPQGFHDLRDLYWNSWKTISRWVTLRAGGEGKGIVIHAASSELAMITGGSGVNTTPAVLLYVKVFAVGKPQQTSKRSERSFSIVPFSN